MKTYYETIGIVQKIMEDFAESTGLAGSDKSPRRYLWTDAFAVCNFTELHHRTGDKKFQQSALRLVDQVHSVLGRHRDGDPRTGWISGLSEEEGKSHPTIGGLRIGKRLNERKPDDPYDDRLEWDRDGQYYHYLTKWMHALNRVSRSTGNPIFNFWAIELAKASHARFMRILPDGSKRLIWKMSIDLSYPLVPSMGHHDPLDGWSTCSELRATAAEVSDAPGPDLDSEIAELEALCRGKEWATEDPLGIGGLLSDAFRVAQLSEIGGFKQPGLMKDLLESSQIGLDAYARGPQLGLPADYRLAFRELGMTIGLHAVERIEARVGEKPDASPWKHPVSLQVDRLKRYTRLTEEIETFWLDPKNRGVSSWTDHPDINSVMLATSLAPDGYLHL